MGKIGQRILIDASRAIRTQPTGIEIYSQEIIRALVELPEARHLHFRLLAPRKPDVHHLLHQNWPNVDWQIIPGERAWTSVRLSWFFLHHQTWLASPLFVPGYILPVYGPKKTIITIHDLAFWRSPELYGRQAALAMYVKLRSSAQRSAAIITPSQATADDVAEYFVVPKEKITVIHHGINHQTFHPLTAGERTHLPAEITSKQPYFLSIGRLELRKNTKRLIDAFARYRSHHASEYQLILMGRPTNPRELSRYLDQVPAQIRRAIHVLGYRSDDELRLWLRAADALVYPSLYEGFGLPVLEAMASGVRVLTSNIASLPEISGQAAVLVDPYRTNDIADGLRTLAEEPAPHRVSRIRTGQDHVRQFTWEQAAQQTLAVILAADGEHESV